MTEKNSLDSSVSNQGRTSVAEPVRKQIKLEWQELWDQKIEDKLIAEDMARRDYQLLFVERGTIIKASRNYKPPNLDEIMQLNEALLGLKLTYPDPEVGGWRKFS